MISLTDLKKFKTEGRKFSCLTCYDASFAKAIQQAGIDSILVGDSLGMTIQGHDSTLPVTVQDMIYHTQAVARANQHAFIMTDLPFMSYATVTDALKNAGAVMQAGAHAVKIEGGAWLADSVQALTHNGVPVCVHLGLTPQFVNLFGGYRLQAKTRNAADQLLADCHAVVEAGAALLLLECVPAAIAKEVAATFDVPVIGIGAGADTDGQVLVVQDMLGLNFGKVARFVRNFMREQSGEHAIVNAIKAYHDAVINQEFPAIEHTFQVELSS
ncbi:3-methyl-2-oxobutanoate hydroxymethyltransferase [Acinetobacter qingfengensis]|uniref:3-methyl-2-oxobutanoate hydroxymethyltransferase n=1 Tax=Acinetobacter qingfengensis TaxID=1262585 RepID=A0A1E7QXD9_9GAMM|nr:3-methyl-2-oxobutanoate hydroxymethyltransferase [Acinetobacter qingfengensis]KAA8731622.1 3-methyl-2-oxobutanoate hydroxymethyltransferase [Acinetobacter qingfengensis]OEY91725.1 3-methyl-2-oxobutanoate hydroxymethyltransferase [Acinetobacter qingfengensis]